MAMIFLIKNLEGRRCLEPKGPCTHRSPGKAGMLNTWGLFSGEEIKYLFDYPEGHE